MKLDHLNDEQISALKDEYLNSDISVTKLLEKYDITGRPGDLVRYLPPTVTEIPCPYCEESFLEVPVSARNSYSSSQEPKCPVCLHRESNVCRCKNCLVYERELIEAKQELKRQDILDLYNSSGKRPEDVTDLSLRHCVYLLSVASHNVSEDMSLCFPYSLQQTGLSPTPDYTHDIVTALRGKHLIAVSEESKLEAFVYGEDGDLLYYPGRVDWLLLPNLSTIERSQYLRDVEIWLEELSADESQFHTANDLWIEIVTYEAIQYFVHKLSEIGYSPDKVGAKTRDVFRSLAVRIPLSRIYHVIFTAVKNTLHFIESRDIPRYKGKNLFIGGVERSFERYEANGWLKDFGRDFSCAQTPTSAIFFNKVQGLGDRYFSSFPPTMV